MAVPDVPQNLPEGGAALKQFQLSRDSIAQKSQDSYGLTLARQIAGEVYGGLSSYYGLRNARYRQNRLIASGKLDILTLFRDRLNMGGKENYINLDWHCIKLGHSIIARLVGRWMGRGEKVVVTAKDSLSLSEKAEQYEQLQFIVENRAMLEQLQAESGVPLIPEGELPEDAPGLHLWATQIQRLPEEICYEMGCNDVLASNGLYGVLKEKLLNDSAITCFVGTYTWMDESGVIHTEVVKPENALYSHSEYDDFRDTTYRGQVRSMKVSELRRRYGKEFGGKLSEEQIFELACKGKDYQQSDKLSWLDNYITDFQRPYDERNVDVLEFEVKTVDAEAYTKVTTKKHGATLLKKGRPERVKDNEEIIEDTRWNIYRGVYVRDTEVMLEWGLKKNMIRPHDPKEVGNAEFSYSFYMPGQSEMMGMAIPEKIEAPLLDMILTRLKIQQLIAKMKPTGAAINVDAMQELDLGLGKMTSPMEAKRIWEQTGDLFYRGRDADGTAIPIPMTELANAGFANQMQALIQKYQFDYQILKDELGEDPNLITAALAPRVAASNVQTSQAMAEAATDFYYRAVTRVLGDTAAKVACLLKDSVEYGSSAYRSLIGKEDVTGRIFSTDIELLPTEMELQRFEAWMNQGIAANPDLILYVSPMQLMRVAKENVKLAEELFNQNVRKLIREKQAQAAQNQQQTIEGQIASAQAAEQAKQATEQLIGNMEIEKAKVQGEATNKSAVIAMVTGLLGKGVPVPGNMQPLVQAVVENLIVPMVAQTEEMKQALVEQMQAASQPPQEQPAPAEQMPQEQMMMP
jgi:hypothetical protein